MSGNDNSEYEGYRSPLSTRYATKEMQFLFSDQFKFSTWRKLWIFLAQAEKVCNHKTNANVTNEFVLSLNGHSSNALAI